MEGEEVEKAHAMVQPMHLDHIFFRSCSKVDPNSAMWSLNSSTEGTEGTWTNSKERVVGCDLWVSTSSEWIRRQWTTVCCYWSREQSHVKRNSTSEFPLPIYSSVQGNTTFFLERNHLKTIGWNEKSAWALSKPSPDSSVDVGIDLD